MVNEMVFDDIMLRRMIFQATGKLMDLESRQIARNDD